MRSLNDKLLYEVMTSFNSDIFVASIEQLFDSATIANIRSPVNHKHDQNKEKKKYISCIIILNMIFSLGINSDAPIVNHTFGFSIFY